MLFPVLDISEPTGDDLPLPALPYISDPAVWSFTSSGGQHYDENLDLSLCVPLGTVSENETLKLKVGACCYGPFSVPDRYLVVTAFYCIVASQKLQNPVEVEMGHCLLTPQYQKSRSICVFKADHTRVSTSDKHIFEFLTHPEISSDRPYLSFAIQDFCILCGVVESNPEEQGSVPVVTTHAATDNPTMTSDEGHAVQESEQSTLDQLTDTDRDTGGQSTSSGIQHSGIATVPKRRQLKRQRSIECDSPAKRHCRAEYAVLLFEPQNVTSSPFSFLIFVCEYCHVAIKVRFLQISYTIIVLTNYHACGTTNLHILAYYTIQECKKQAKELGYHHPPSLLQVEFADSEIKFVPNVSGLHAVQIEAKTTPVVSEHWHNSVS